MTTIAWDGKTLAADTRAVNATMAWRWTKIFRLKDGRLYGGASDSGCCLQVRDWLVDPALPRPVADKDVGFSGLLIDSNGCWRLDSYLVAHLIESPFHAIGSGRDYAMAAMHLGRDAEAAVEVAAVFDIYTGGPITTLRLEA